MTIFRGLQPWLQPYAQYFYDVLRRAGLEPRVTSVFRSPQQQQVLYERYLRGESKLPAAPPGRSKHQYGLAFDLVCSDFAAAGQFWQAMGGRWGAERDPVHFEAP